MKERLGFVSNSSSSSFVAFASKEVMDAALEDCTDIQKEALKKYISKYDEDFFGRTLYTFSYYHSSEEYDEDICDLVDAYFPNKDKDDYTEIEKLTEFVFEGIFDKILVEKAFERGETVLSHGDYKWKKD